MEKLLESSNHTQQHLADQQHKGQLVTPLSSFEPIRLFVYGTLMQGYGNHSIISKYPNTSQRFLGIAKTVNKYSMVCSGVPFVNS